MVTMVTLYVICAAVGCTVMVIQLALTLMGADSDSDFDVDASAGDAHIDVGGGGGDAHVDIDLADGEAHVDVSHGDGADADHHGPTWFFSVLSFRALVAAVAFFGLAGYAGEKGGLSNYMTFVTATAAGVVAMIIVAWLMRLLHQLTDEGNVQIRNALGVEGTVYLTIPENKSGRGKVTVKIQNRTMEYQAMTSDEALPTGTPVVVSGILGNDILEVSAAKDRKED